MVNPVPKLMADTMARKNLVDVLKPHSVAACSPKHGSLSEAQAAAVATVQSPVYREGIFAIQGPPGTGENKIVAAMFSQIDLN